MALNLNNLTTVLTNLASALQAQNTAIQALIVAHTDVGEQNSIDSIAVSAQAIVDTVTQSTAQINAALQT
jgi:hypothetical protein